MSSQNISAPKHPIILCSHCVYHEGVIYSEFPEDRAVYEQQLRRSVEELQSIRNDTLVISGGYTTKEVEKSEAKGMFDWAVDLNLDFETDRVVLEEYARDSFENVLFSMCKFFEVYRYFPESVTICSWKPKLTRFLRITEALALPNSNFLGVGEKDELTYAEDSQKGNVAQDPLHRGFEYSKKRISRDVWEKGNPYRNTPEFEQIFASLDKLQSGVPLNISWPWAKTSRH